MGMIFLKTLVYSSKYAKGKSVPEPQEQQDISPSETPALRRHSPHTPTQLLLARSHARTTRTRNETETNFPINTP